MAKINDFYAKAFLDNQLKLFPEPVCDTVDEALEFLDDVMAQVFDSPEEIIEYLDDCGMDVLGMTPEDILDANEVFVMPDGKYLLVEA